MNEVEKDIQWRKDRIEQLQKEIDDLVEKNRLVGDYIGHWCKVVVEGSGENDHYFGYVLNIDTSNYIATFKPLYHYREVRFSCSPYEFCTKHRHTSEKLKRTTNISDSIEVLDDSHLALEMHHIQTLFNE